jgi:hypothetical protein
MRVQPQPPNVRAALLYWDRRARNFIRCAAVGWDQRKLQKLDAARASVLSLLRRTQGPGRKKVAKMLWKLNTIKKYAQIPIPPVLADPGNPARHQHPDRTRINVYRAASGRVRWATPKR